MKVAYLLGGLNRGGTEMLALQVFEHSLRYEMDFVCIYRKRGVLLDNFTNTGIHLVQLKNKLLYFQRLRRIIKNENIQIVHSHLVLDTLLAYLSCLGLNVKIIFSLHSHGLNDSILLKIMRGFIIYRTSLNIFVSKSLLEFYKKRYGKLNENCQKIVYNSVDLKISKKSRTGNFNKEYKIKENTLILAMIGSFTSVRDQITVCRFLLLLSKKDIPFQFFFVGGKAHKEAFLYDECIEYCTKNNLLECVYFTGVRDDVPDILNQLDAFIYSSEHDTFGLAVIEAVAAAVPVFVNDWEVMCEITDNGKLATLYKSKNEQDLLEKFLNFIENKEIYDQKAKAASEIVKEKYSIESHIKKLKSVYQSVLTLNIHKKT